jgi:hypothetical protein
VSLTLKPRALSSFALGVFTALGVFASPLKGTGDGQSPGGVDPSRVLNGAIDFHVHSLPDMQPRSIDAIEVAKLARSRGMRGIVLKNHYDQTAGLAYIVRQVVPGLEVFGGIDLNLTQGGINAAAVEHMTAVTGGWGRVVWFPTNDSEAGARNAKEPRPFVSVALNGELLPEVKNVISLIAKHGLVLETGHSSPEESLLLLQEGRRQGVQRMLVTHAAGSMTVAQMQEAVKLGAFIEWIYGHILTTSAIGRKARWTDPDYAQLIRTVGVESSVLSTDLGQAGNPLPPDGLAAFIMRLAAQGFTTQELDRMTKENPARLLGLSLR